ncbi:PepSY-associated TM helix domain-containing protein [Alteromonas sp. 009811495]|uniref:PepSY-associated TM helix domain-containing protein n=1 Tax=Alteromonas sp. 009811495 TaxID=3002962 RepID=UPI00237ED134|nr:PepSY-associated TM helix domain-containing protein [Alteromonas sp. 009811495]WDT86831.1 PepSY-associated TM helix domain-containing protein [Alteromonas sp. 009811495]
MSRTRERQYLKKLYNLHAWVGFQLATVMFVILITGTFATISNEIDWLIFDEMRATSENRNTGSAPNWSAIYNAASRHASEIKIKSISTMGSDYFTYRVRAQFEDGKDRFIHVDQYTNEVTGNIPLLTVQRLLRDFHRYLFMPNYLGMPTVTFFAFILAISLYTGLKTTRNWKTAITRLRFRQGPRILLSDLHKVCGLWAIWFVVIIVLTSWWYLFEFGAAVGGTRFEPPAPKLTHSIHEKYNAPISAHQLDKAVRIAESAIDNWQITSIQFPSSPKSTLRFKGVGDNPLLRDRAHKVDIDPVTLEVIAVQSPDNMAWTNYINEYADPIHFGYFGGLATKAIWFIFGLGLTALSATGVMMTWKRTKSTALTKAQIRTLPVFAVSAICFVVWLSRYL